MLTIRSRCWLCRQPLCLAQHGICSYCLRRLPAPPTCCPCCGLPAGDSRYPCGRCLQKMPPWRRLVFVTDYVSPLSQLVKRLKFQRRPELALLLARLLLLRWLQLRREQYLNRPELILTVPLQKMRRWRRGYNQSELLATPLARWLGCEYRPRALRRIRATAAQQRLTARQRRRNLRGAFRCDEDLAGRHVALLDDVVTTGSTAAEIAALLQAQGVASLQIWCICRTL
ncbi:DNA utilization protein GntX [Serratia rubidaea]|uniref:DNA utilization protein GntX n=1 Tax=Serratia rubidaea TaxID=61652 RepID=A0A4U9HWB2_SERRU|nr:DNA utilization protein GntX [Serratia rubidaea]QPR64736.1 DNA utilization protein GntX [Serratia rubidaea]CAI1110368.1 DNA utilization protein GntX [Serratia rubidaea]CAI1908805.1 DNA utilization protein GntX [Serratia rubidaea]VTP68245.1 DNA utilization protein GntX [Serratia rubidaea]HAY0638978.1 DNA utilization protein GntX [Serratia rubidaea]